MCLPLELQLQTRVKSSEELWRARPVTNIRVQHFQFSEEQMNQLLIAICKGGKSEANMATTTKRFSTNK